MRGVWDTYSWLSLKLKRSLLLRYQASLNVSPVSFLVPFLLEHGLCEPGSQLSIRETRESQQLPGLQAESNILVLSFLKIVHNQDDMMK